MFCFISGSEFIPNDVDVFKLYQNLKYVCIYHTFFLLVLVSAVPGCHQLLGENQILKRNQTNHSCYWNKDNMQDKIFYIKLLKLEIPPTLFMTNHIDIFLKVLIVVYTCDFSTKQVVAGGSQQVWSQPGLVFQESKEEEKEKEKKKGGGNFRIS